MRRLLAVFLLAPAIASAQLRPARLVATRALYIAADSARLAFWGGMLGDRNGTLFYARFNDTVDYSTSVVVEAPSDGRVRNTGPAGAAVSGRLLGWIGVANHDSLRILHDDAEAILVPGQAPAKLGDRWNTEPGVRGDTLLSGLPSALLADGSTLWTSFHFDSVGRRERRKSLPSLFVRVEPGSRTPRIIATIPPGLNCIRHDRKGNAIDAPPICRNFRYDLAPTGTRIAEAFRTPDQLGLIVLSLTATGDTIFRKEFALAPAILPDSAVGDVVAPDDTTLSAAVRALWTADERADRLGSIIAGDDGTTWVGLESAAWVPERWIEINAHGALVGEVAIPLGTELLGGLRDRVWGIVPAAAGPYAGVVMYKISKP